MTPSLQEKLRWIIDLALNLEEPARTQYLATAGEGDPELQRRIADLLEGSGEAEDFLATSPATLLEELESSHTPFDQLLSHSAAPFAGNEIFEIIRSLGSGGSSDVYEAFDRRLNIRVAVKVLRCVDPRLVARFKEGSRAVQNLAHPNLCRIYGLVQDQTSHAWLLSMQLIEGRPLLDAIRAKPSRIREFLAQLATALQTLHSVNVCHGDVKPANILVDSDDRLVLHDFGLSMRLDVEHREHHQAFAVTPKYAAPELLASSSYSSFSDWYSVGVMILEALETFPTSGHDDLRALANRLVVANPAERPREAEILRVLAPMLIPVRGRGTRSPIFGREQELHVVRCMWRSVMSDGGTAVVQVTGPSGIGKTAFVQHVITALHHEHPALTPVLGRCYQGEALPFNAFDEIASRIAAVIRKLPLQTQHNLVGSDAPLLARLFPAFSSLPGRAPGVDPSLLPSALGEFRRQAFEAFSRLLVDLSREIPLILLIDDFQWSDEDSKLLLSSSVERLCAAGPNSRSLVILAFRSDDDAQGAAGKGDDWPPHGRELNFLKSNRCTLLTLGPLDDRAARQLVSSLIGDEALAGENAVLVTEARGNPFLLQQIAEFRRSGGRADLASLVRERAAALPPNERRSLEVLSVAQAPVPLAVLRDAADLGEHVRLVKSELDSGHLIRSLETPDEAVQPYHDRIAEEVAKAIIPERRRELNRRIAVAFEQNGTNDVERIAVHYHEAGELTNACKLGRLAAQRSAEALAFERAAALFASVLEWSMESGAPILTPDEIVEVQIARGDALANSGKGVDAARMFEEALLRAPENALTPLRIRVASELLRSGQVNEGLVHLKSLLTRHGLPFPLTRSDALRSYVIERLRLAWGLLFRRERRSGMPLESNSVSSERLDVCWAAATGTGMVYPLLAEIYCLIFLRLELPYTNPKRHALAWASYASRLAYIDDGEVRAARSLMKRAERFATMDGTPYTLAFMEAMWATIEGLNGSWRTCFQHAERAEILFRTCCTGVAWEHATVSTYLFTSRTMLGEWTANAQLLPVYLAQAKARGNRYAEATVSVVSAGYACDLIEDQPERAVINIEQQLASWPHGTGLDVQQVYGFQSLLNLDLYRGDAQRAWSRVEGIWKDVEASGLLGITLVQTFLEDARARAALAVAKDAVGAHRKRMLNVTLKTSRLLSRSRARYAPGLAHLLAAGVYCLERKSPETAFHLLRAEEVFEETETVPWLATTRLLLSSHLKIMDRDQKLRLGMNWFVTQKIRRPECIVRMLFPVASLLRD